jgi:hypothetical protein
MPSSSPGAAEILRAWQLGYIMPLDDDIQLPLGFIMTNAV